MAKGQKRNSREPKKPKAAAKKVPEAASVFTDARLLPKKKAGGGPKAAS